MEIVKVNEVLEAIEDIRRKKELESSIAYGHGFYAGIAKIEKLIKEKACTVDEFTKRGHWIDAYPAIEPNPMHAYAMCSECGYKQAISNKLNYCPNCGTKMYGEESLAPTLKHLKEICDKHADSCKCYGNGKDTSCPMYFICDDEYGIHFPCNWNLESDV